MPRPTALGVPVENIGADAEILRDRIALLTGATSWALHSLPSRGLRSIVLSDGPIGVRGIDGDDRPSAQLPSPTALAATFDRELVTRLGQLIGKEARRKGVDVVLAPVVNLQRTPYGGRHFEAFSEDPFLTGELASVLIQATQSLGVGMCVKHFLGNESETERTTYIAKISERALREVYLAPFERTVLDAKVWSVMAAYNGVDDGKQAAPATEHNSLINGVLKGEWGFDGVVVSDWLATKTTIESALGGLDLVMPGPDGPWGSDLEDAVIRGSVPAAVIDDKVDRIARLGSRVGAVGDSATVSVPADLPTRPETRALLREAVARSSVVLRNGGLLPLSASQIGSLALIGPNAADPFIQGGGSASVTPPLLSSPLDALRNALPNAHIDLHVGTSGRKHTRPVSPEDVATPDGRAGYLLTYFDSRGDVVGEPQLVPASEDWNRGAPDEATDAQIDAIVKLTAPGAHRLEVGVSGAHQISFNEVVVSESEAHADHSVILDSSANNPTGPVADYTIDRPSEVTIRSRQQVVDAGAYGRFVRFALRHEISHTTPEEDIARAVAAARAAEIAVVIVGTNEETESEGWDRPNLQLPGRQNELVERVLEANQNTIVVVNAGAPVVLPWLDRAAAVLWWWLPGQEAGAGLADALLGVTEPSGRLPWTLPADEADVPELTVLPEDGIIEYSEGIHVGYRGWDRAERTPAREFGFGLGYGSWVYEQLDLAGGPDDLEASVRVTNIGIHDAREIVQIYLETPGSEIDRPARWLAGFATVDVAAGASMTVTIPLRRRSLETWNSESHDWEIPNGRYLFHAARSSRDLRLTAAATLHDHNLALG
jgi:beta-glucosidase